MLVASDSKVSGSVDIAYLFALSELAKSYCDYSLEDNIEQLINFLTISDTIFTVQNGILREVELNERKEFKDSYYNKVYSQISSTSEQYDSELKS